MGKTAFAAGCVVLGILAIITPWTLFPVCDGTIETIKGTFVPMKCHWTGRAASAAGGMVVFAGIVVFFARSAHIRAGTALMLLPAGALLFFLPGDLIGVCKSEMMPCRMGTLPALQIIGALVFLAGIAGFLMFRKSEGAGKKA